MVAVSGRLSGPLGVAEHSRIAIGRGAVVSCGGVHANGAAGGGDMACRRAAVSARRGARTAAASARSGRIGPAAPGGSDARPRPARALDLWVSPAAVRQAIGAWAYTRTGNEPHPGDDLVRTAVGVACAIAECAAATAAVTDAAWSRPAGDAVHAASGSPLARPVAYDAGRLAELAGVAPRDVDRAVAVLQGAGVVRWTADGTTAQLALDDGVLAPLPAVARVDWDAVRRRLAAVGAGVGAPAAVLRTLAERMGAVDLAGAELPSVRASVRDLEDATRFGRSTVSEAVAALVRARVLDADTRAGHTGRFVLRPCVFGLPDEAPESAPAVVDTRWPAAPGSGTAPAGAGGVARPVPVGAAAVQGAVDGGPSTAAGRPVLVGTFAGTPIYAPAGTPLVVECDAEGRWVCRVGPFLQLGPVAES
jgi:hypothetical protein